MQGIKVAKFGKDASSIDPRDFTLHSQYNMMKVHMAGVGTASIDDDDYLWSLLVQHDLGYKPQVFFWIEHPVTEKILITPGKFDPDFDDSTYGLSGAVSNPNDDQIQLEMGIAEDAPSYPVSVRYSYEIMIEPRKDAWYE